jgi:hypothetical protein
VKTSQPRASTFVLGALALILGGVFLAPRARSQRANDEGGFGTGPEPHGPRAILGLRWARAFTLERAAPQRFLADGSSFLAGWLVVLQAQSELCLPRQEPEPILMFGAQPALRVNHGWPSGHIVAILPHDAGRAQALFEELLFLSEPGVSDQLGAGDWQARVRRAQQAGLSPLEAGSVQLALQRGGAPLVLTDEEQLWQAAAGLVLLWSPDERELAEAFLLPAPR